MPANYVLLGQVTVGAAGVASVTFSSIPQTGYTDLKIVTSARTTYSGGANDGLTVRYNGNNTNYTFTQFYGDGTNAASNAGSASVGPNVPTTSATSNTFGNAEIYIRNYRNSSFKSTSMDAVGENNATSAIQTMIGTLWSNTAAITSVYLASSSGANFMADTTFSLYGIAALGTTPVIAPKATGGNSVYNDGTYWYHTFTTSGTFVPSQNITCDYLVVAGGGAGAGNSGGGGGAGGMRCTVTGTGGSGALESPLALSANASYAVTIGGGGGSNNANNLLRGFNGSDSIFATITALGGGGGGNRLGGSPIGNGAVGGSGGGAAVDGYTGGAGTSGQGFGGGSAPGSTNPGGGGGGAAAVGQDGGTANLNGGDGGAGRATVISGTSVTYAGGGGGAYNTAGSGEGGIGGGGSNGGATNTAGNSGTVNTGGGGGAGTGGAGTGLMGGAGGSGIVIVRYTVA
jgi:hypothetical protein